MSDKSASSHDVERPPEPTENTPLLPPTGALKRGRLTGKLHSRALIPKAHTKIVTTKGVEMIHTGTKINYVDKSRDIDKIIAFDPESVLGWASMLKYQGTVFQMNMVVGMLACNFCLGMTVAYITSLFPAVRKNNFNTDMLDALIKFLIVFLAFVTGMFVNGAFKRWSEILGELFDVLQAVKKVYLDLAMHGVPQPVLYDIRRWGILSVALAALEAPAQWEPPEWEKEFNDLVSDDILKEEEKRMLMTKLEGSKATLVWVWIVMKLQECSMQGLTPPRTTPAFVKMMDHCQEATVSINRMYELIIFQVPHQYMHMLAFLIHLFNIINTVRCGVELGSVWETIYASKYGRPTAMQVQNIIAYGLIMMLSPLIYQAFLSISLDISIPFGSGSTDVPVRFFLDRFHQELDDMDLCIKKPAKGSALPPSKFGTYSNSRPAAPKPKAA